MNLLWNSVANLLFIDTRHMAAQVVAVRREFSGNDVHKRRGARGNRDRRARALPFSRGNRVRGGVRGSGRDARVPGGNTIRTTAATGPASAIPTGVFPILLDL
jgi:hypothetical protein